MKPIQTFAKRFLHGRKKVDPQQLESLSTVGLGYPISIHMQPRENSHRTEAVFITGNDTAGEGIQAYSIGREFHAWNETSVQPQLGLDAADYGGDNLGTPRLTTVPLPSITTYQSEVGTSGGARTIPGERRQSQSTIHGLEPIVDIELQRTLDRHPVVLPFSSDLPPYEGHLWGAVYNYRQAAGGRAIHFIDSTAPATQPPIRSMEVITGGSRSLPIFLRSGNEFITVGDVQRVVIAWMRSIDRLERLHGHHTGLLEMWPVYQGSVGVNIEVWMWRGLDYERPGAWSLNL
ncbi:hypothetical protein NP233_g12294 [Leucocoprinus birnbaumii]|uniref:Uncharacterized protein n=1 Tax=Leucocoprinus birnbaumii TaxID=56174 RepID=A0AAD5YQ57_9AGAR|nr:hypothetical protein NP233_g12294 [Leucocoprinus birnbaumii]